MFLLRPAGAMFVAISCVMFLTSEVPAARGQSRLSGEIRGTVTDTSGAALPGVAVSITNTQTNIVQRFSTDNAGVYDAPIVPARQLHGCLLKGGFCDGERKDITVHVDPLTVNAQMPVASTAEDRECP